MSKKTMASMSEVHSIIDEGTFDLQQSTAQFRPEQHRTRVEKITTREHVRKTELRIAHVIKQSYGRTVLAHRSGIGIDSGTVGMHNHVVHLFPEFAGQPIIIAVKM